jgi:uncharacterized protein (TIGR02594 family)
MCRKITRLIVFFSLLILLSCSPDINSDISAQAKQYVGLHEYNDRKEIKKLVGVDPVRIEWCAAFVNAVLGLQNIPGSESVSSVPLMARSFLKWGDEVKGRPRKGDIIVFPRGNKNWQGHVGFYIQTILVNGEEKYVILGGNQDNTINYATYSPSKALGIRRYTPEF